MQRTSTRLGLSLLVLLLALGLGACGGPASEPATDAAAEPATDSSDAASTDSPATSADGEQVVNLYSARHYDTDDQLYEGFFQATGIRVHRIEGDSAALLERLRREGEQSPADVFMAVDAGRLHQAETEGIFQPIESEILSERIPENLRHPEGLWFGLTKRARILVYAKDRVQPDAISTYEELAQPEWKGRVLIRSSSNIYNQSLMGSIVAAHGEEAAEEWCRGLVENLARKPQGGDRDQVRAIAAGEGDIAVANSYYLAHMAAGSEADREVAAQVGVIFPNQGDRGTHVNISGAGVVRGAANRDNAIRFLEYLTSPEAQAIFAGGNKEYPVVEGTASVPELEAFGDFEEDSLNASVFGANNQTSLMIMDRCGWR